MATADLKNNNTLKVQIALQNEPANVKRDLMATADRNFKTH